MPRKWQVQLGPNFIKHNPICALILPKRLAADAALPDEKGRKKKKGKKEEEESQEACGSFSKLLSVQLSFPFSSSLLRNKIRRTYLESLSITKLSIRRRHLWHGLNWNLLFLLLLFLSFFLFLTRGRKIRPDTDGKNGWWRKRSRGRRAVSVKTQIVSRKEDVATWPILAARVPAPFDLLPRFIDIGILSTGIQYKKFKLDHYRAAYDPNFLPRINPLANTSMNTNLHVHISLCFCKLKPIAQIISLSVSDLSRFEEPTTTQRVYVNYK